MVPGSAPANQYVFWSLDYPLLIRACPQVSTLLYTRIPFLPRNPLYCLKRTETNYIFTFSKIKILNKQNHLILFAILSITYRKFLTMAPNHTFHACLPGHQFFCLNFDRPWKSRPWNDLEANQLMSSLLNQSHSAANICRQDVTCHRHKRKT